MVAEQALWDGPQNTPERNRSVYCCPGMEGSTVSSKAFDSLPSTSLSTRLDVPLGDLGTEIDGWIYTRAPQPRPLPASSLCTDSAWPRGTLWPMGRE